MARILIVDDETSVRALLSRFLNSQGHETVEAETGEQALPLAAGGDPDVILLDIDMPGIDGLETLRRLRRQTPECVVVMLSGIKDEKRAIEALDEGARDYVAKPFELKHLRDVIAQQLALRS